MTLRNEFELANTRTKLRELEERYTQLSSDCNEDLRIRDLTMRSLKRLINQLKEEITLFEVHHPAPR
jgi:hypothetical protein